MNGTYLHLAVFSSIVFLFCAALFLSRWADGRQARQQLDTLAAKTVSQAAETTGTGVPIPAIFVTGDPQTNGASYAPPLHTAEDILPQYRALYEENNDLTGWLEIPGTMLNLPVMYTPENREYYLHRLFDGSESLYGVPFLDGDCSVEPRSTNLILHGHHMTDGTMFSTLAEYQDEAFFHAHPKIRFDTLYEEGQYEILAVFLSVYDETDADPNLYYNFIDAKDARDFDRFIALVQGQSLYDTGVTASYGDALITLITCMDNVENGRINVVAKKSKR